MPDLVGQFELRRCGHLDHEAAALFDEIASPGDLVQYDRELGWL